MNSIVLDLSLKEPGNPNLSRTFWITLSVDSQVFSHREPHIHSHSSVKDANTDKEPFLTFM